MQLINATTSGADRRKRRISKERRLERLQRISPLKSVFDTLRWRDKMIGGLRGGLRGRMEVRRGEGIGELRIT